MRKQSLYWVLSTSLGAWGCSPTESTDPSVAVNVNSAVNEANHAAGYRIPSQGAPHAKTETRTPIKHVVVIFQENVSFDHYFATYPYATNNTGSEPTFTAAPNTPSVNGLNGPLLTNNPNSAQPFRLTFSGNGD